MKLTGHITTLLLSLAIFLPVQSSAQTEVSVVLGGQGKASSPATAVEGSGEFIEEYEIFFRFDKTDVDINYLSNKKHVASIRHYLANSHRVDSITIYSYASPEGRYKHNMWLSQQRAHAAKRVLLKHSPDSSVLNSGMIRICPLAENWPGLIREVEERYQRRDRERVLRILKNKHISDDTRKWRLGRLDGGYTWSFLRRRFMPELRVATWVCVYGEIVPPLPYFENPQIKLQTPHLPLAKPASNPQKARKSDMGGADLDKSQRTVVALKTNLLLDAASALNYAIEVPVNEHFSLQYFQTTPWWTSKNNKFCLQALTFGGEARWWFLPRTSAATENRKQRDALVGHFLGAYGWGGKGDLQLGRNVCQQFDFWSAGLTYGYSLAVSKHLNMEFTLSVGYADINYQHYVPTDDFSLLVRDDNVAGRLHYIGPTKAEISLVIPIRATVGKKAANKGGDR